MKKYIYQEQLLLWKKNQIILREKYMDTPAGFSTPEQLRIEMAAWQKEYNSYQATASHQLLSIPQYPDIPELIGRDVQLRLLQETLAQSHTAILYGMGGIGKTAIASYYLKTHANSYDYAIFLISGKSIVDAICNDRALPIAGLSFDRKKYASLHAYFLEKIKILRELSKQNKILLIIDNVNDVSEKELKRFLSIPCDKILTTRVEYPFIPNECKIEITALPAQSWPNLIRSCSPNLSDDMLTQVLRYGRTIGGHTLSLKLASIQAQKGLLPKTDWDIVSLLSSYSLSPRELEPLLQLALFSPLPMEKGFFQLLTGTSDRTLHTLEKDLLIDINDVSSDNEEASMLSVHPLIAAAVKTLYPPNCFNCSKILRGFEAYMNGSLNGIITWDRSFQENHALEPYVFALYEAFPNPVPWLGKAFEELTTFLWVQGYFTEALDYALKIYHSVSDYYGSDHVMPGREALRVAAVYHNKLDYDNALIWYRKGYELLKAVKHPNFECILQLILVCGKLARSARYNGDLDSLYTYRKEFEDIVALQSRRKDLDDHEIALLHMEYYYSKLEWAKFLLSSGEQDASRSCYQEIKGWLDSQENLFYRRVTFEVFYISLLLQDGSLQEAETIARSVVEQTLFYRGKKYKDYLIHLELLADILMMNQKRDEALSCYGDLLVHLQTDYSFEQAWIDQVLHKMQQ